MKLIVTEKDNAARRIAEILSERSAEVERRNGVNVYRWGRTCVVGLSGHVVGLDFPSEYDNWRDVEPVELIDAPVVTEPTQENIVRTLTELAREADEAVIATDYDREGELIGKEAYELIADEVTGPISRVRFSSITDTEVRKAFANSDNIDFNLAAAGEARQIIDLIWGAALTRFLSLSARQLGDDFISVGRVQSPTLKLIVDREREIEAFDPETYWELFANLTQNGDSFEAQYFYEDDGSEAERIWESEHAERVHAALQDADAARVASVRRRTRTDTPPEPFATTAFISAASSLGFSAQRAMSIAEDLYTAGYITYPRTDNTVYPEDLDPEELVREFDGTAFDDDVAYLLDLDDLEPTAGDDETTDHPPIHPTGEFPPDLDEAEWRIYELVVRHFFATVADPATWAHLRVVAEVGEHRLKANGKRLLEEGYYTVYPYSSASENHVPAVENGEMLSLSDVRLDEKETRPPRRYGQSRLIKKMEELGLGTKCLTGDSNVLVRNDEGDIVQQRIDSLFESGQVALADGDTDIATVKHSLPTLSLDEQTETVVERPQTLVSKRPLGEREQVYHVQTERGSFSITEEHPVYVWEDDEITVLPAAELDSDTTLVAARRPRPRCETEHSTPVLTGEDHSFSPAWSPAVARLIGSLLGAGSIHREAENIIDLRYRSTSSVVTEQVAADIETLVGVRPPITERAPTTERDGSWSPHNSTYEVKFSPASGRLFSHILDTVLDDGVPDIPESLYPFFIGAVFDEVGHISRDGTAFISTSDHTLLAAVRQMLAKLDIDSKLATDQQKLHIRGRRNLERFLDTVPISSDTTFYRGCDTLREYRVTRRKAAVLERIQDESKTIHQLTEELGVRRSVIRTTVRELRADGHVEKRTTDSNRSREEQHATDSNRSRDEQRPIRYRAVSFEESVYATLRGVPSTLEIRSIDVREYDGAVYDLTINQRAPNFAVQGGSVIHNSTRHHIIEKLYDRGYIESDPPRPTALAGAVVEAAEEFADRVVTDEMTAQLERDMTAIADGEATLEEVTEESRAMLAEIFDELRESHEEIGEHIQESLKADRRLGACPECGEQLLVRRSRHGSYFVGCEGFPECRFTLPLPSSGEPLVLEEVCDIHELHHVKMLAGRDTFVHGCPLCAAAEADESEDRVIGACPECGEEHGGELAIKKVRSGSRLIGCTRYPDCEYSLPLPRRGDIEVTDDRCEEHDLPELIVQNGDEPWELGCPICNYREYRREQAVTELSDIDGIGERTVEKLTAAGIDSPADLDTADPDALADELQGVTAKTLREWQAQLAT